jgi:NAD(P)H-hydrate repair Nnr-like enzyme with NAD(P)H-hydrate epimerase domain
MKATAAAAAAGGDGLVAGRHLTHFGYDVQVSRRLQDEQQQASSNGRDSTSSSSSSSSAVAARACSGCVNVCCKRS